ncbi:tetraspanin-8-like [Clinocottus analis]|uniref:tetraspanin-8-like n=1 Tax=Clinocottus analis TaxID=304258 RepID=UPI0035BFD267
MGKINGCLKCLFIFFNVLYAILGCVLVYLVAKSTVYSNQLSMVGGPSMGWGWVFAIGVLGISCLGIYAGISENRLALKIFAGFMVVGMIIMMIFGVIVVVARNKLKEQLDSVSAELAKPFIADDEMRAMLEELQRSAKCCGVVSEMDWDDHIPTSCQCSAHYHAPGALETGCKVRPKGTSGPDQIFSQTCGDVIFSWMHLFFQILMGFFFGLAVTALLGLLVSLLMVHQVGRHDGAAGSSIAMKGY